MKQPKLILALVLGLALYAAATVGSASGAPAAGGTLAQSLGCNPAAPAPVFLGRGSTLREPDLGQVADNMPTSAQGQAEADFSATVPVYFHVVTDGSMGNVTRAQIEAQMDVLNNTFSGGEGGSNTGFSFELKGVTRTDNAKWFYASIGGAEKDMKKTLHQGGSKALNLYSTTAGPYLGWAYLPDVTNKGNAVLDGVVFDWESIPGTSTTYAGRYDKGETATHEVGHWLNLEHTFFGGCADKGDFVDDTPAEKTPTSGCPAGKDTCPKDPGLDPIHNYMDYSYDACYTEFTPGQATRMAQQWLYYRAD